MRSTAGAAGFALALLACQPRDQRATSSPPVDSVPAAPVATATGATQDDTAFDRPVDDRYLGERLEGQFGFVPKMAWIIPPHRLIAEVLLTAPRTLGHRGVEAWTFHDTIPPDRAMELRREQHLSCEGTGPLYEYSGEDVPQPFAERVLLINSSGPEIRAEGVISAAPSSSWIADAIRIVLARRSSAAHRDTTATGAPGGEFYSFHGAYDTSAAADEANGTHGVRYLIRRAVLLHGPGGAVVASSITNVAPVECDGCGTPTITDGFGTVFALIQVFRIQGFPHPVLLFDTSTVEGRALSLETFDEGGVYRSYREYEYVVNCF